MLKKILLALIFVTIFSTASFADISAKEAYLIAKAPTDDPLIGIWKAYGVTVGEREFKGNALCAIIPSTDNPNWDYVIVMLEDYFVIEAGVIKGRLRKTDNPAVLWSKSAEYVSALVIRSLNGPVIYSRSDGLINFSSVQQGDYRMFMVMTKGDYVIEELEPEEPKDESWREFLAPKS